jgi:hypothetical protein
LREAIQLESQKMVVRHFNFVTDKESKSSLHRSRLSWKFVLAAVAVSLLSSTMQQGYARDKDDFADNIPERLFAQNTAPTTPTPAMATDAVVPMPSIDPYYPIRFDGSAYYTMNDMTVNMTAALNHFYYDPKWRGEVWEPMQLYNLVEKGSRIMPTWQEYDQFSWWRTCNLWHKFWERSSGYGP